MKIVYVHGLGGSGNGSSAKGVQALAKELLGPNFTFSAGTYDLLKPAEAFAQIEKDVAGADVVIASSLGGFCASCLDVEKLNIGKIILLNPCLNPVESIPGLLYEEQKAGFDQEMCFKQWNELQSHWDKDNLKLHDKFAGIFATGDEYFHYQNVFRTNFKSSNENNLAEIEGVHEIAKHPDQLKNAVSAAISIFEKAE